MKNHLLILLITFISVTSCVSSQESRDSKFWEWFKEHQTMLYEFERDQDRVFSQLSIEMAKVDPDLTFEFGPVTKNGKRDFVISAGGIKKAFPKVESLYNSAPKLDKWVFIKFRPRRETYDIRYGGTTLRKKDIRFILMNDDDKNKAKILLLLEGYNDKEKDVYGQIGFLFLDQALGEYDVETRVGGVDFLPMNSDYYKKSLPITELTRSFDAYFSHQR